MKTLLAFLLACGAATSASAVSIQNGSFELGAPIPANSFISVPALDSTSITGWTVGGDGVDYIGTYWQAQDGERSVDLSRLSAGSISQAIATDIGRSYRVNFWLSGNPDGGQGQKLSVTSVSGSLPDVFTYDVGPANSLSNMLWKPYTFLFTAFNTTSTLTFAAVDHTPFGPAIDNVSITAVPEPQTWAMLILGMGMVGVSVRSRRQRSVAA